MTTLTRLQQRVDALIPQVTSLLRIPGLDQYQVRALTFLGERLAEIRDEARNGTLEQLPERKGEIARIVEESDPAVLSPVLGGALMEVEAEYYSAK